MTSTHVRLLLEYSVRCLLTLGYGYVTWFLLLMTWIMFNPGDPLTLIVAVIPFLCAICAAGGIYFALFRELRTSARYAAFPLSIVIALTAPQLIAEVFMQLGYLNRPEPGKWWGAVNHPEFGFPVVIGQYLIVKTGVRYAFTGRFRTPGRAKLRLGRQRPITSTAISPPAAN